MPTGFKKIGTTPEHIWSPANPSEWADILVVNKSVATIYFGDADVTTATGQPILPEASNGRYANDHQAEPLYLVADAADSEVRITFTVFKDKELVKTTQNPRIG